MSELKRYKPSLGEYTGMVCDSMGKWVRYEFAVDLMNDIDDLRADIQELEKAQGTQRQARKRKTETTRLVDSDQQYVVIRDMAEGSESVGEMWQETKIFSGDATLDEVMSWAIGFAPNRTTGNIAMPKHSFKRITITKPHPEGGEDEGE